jgi:hypothetical protein
MRCQLTDYECVAIKPMLPNKPCGVPRVNDRRVLDGILNGSLHKTSGPLYATRSAGQKGFP